jgi:hypothetical protein
MRVRITNVHGRPRGRTAATLLTFALLIGCSLGPRVKGFIIAIEEEGGRPAAFTVETDAGPVRILIDEDADYGFDLCHLEQHRTEALPVSVEVVERDGEKVALRIDDA